MEVEVNIWGVVAATVAAMAIGGVWYSKAAFGKTWMKLAKIDEARVAKEGMQSMVGMLFISLVMAYVMAHVTYLSNTFFTDMTFLQSAMSTSFWMWIGFAMPIIVSDSLFNQAPWKLTLIHGGNWLLTFLGMGLAVGLVGLA
jgi:hypothetical protein